MNTTIVTTDDAGQEVQAGDLIYIVSMAGQSVRAHFGRIIKIDTAVHYIRRSSWGGCSKASNPNHYCRIESTNKTKPIEKEIDEFYTEWIKKHKEFQ
jgi:hypothetical protein